MSEKSKRIEALLYHAKPTPGKIKIVPTKKYSSQRDLALAYSPGVAEPCLEIEKNKDNPFFLFFSSHDIHVPRMPHERFQGKTKLGFRGDAIAQLDWRVWKLRNFTRTTS